MSEVTVWDLFLACSRRVGARIPVYLGVTSPSPAAARCVNFSLVAFANCPSACPLHVPLVICFGAMALYDPLVLFLITLLGVLKGMMQDLASARVLWLMFSIGCLGLSIVSPTISNCFMVLARVTIPMTKVYAWALLLNIGLSLTKFDNVVSFKLVACIFLVGLPLVLGACPTCHGAVEGCDGTACPWLHDVTTNAAAVAATSIALTTTLSLKKLLPDGLLQAFPRQALDTLLTMSKLPAKGVPITWTADSLTIPMLKEYWIAGRMSRAEVSRGMDIVTNHVLEHGSDVQKTKLPLQLKSLEIALKDEPNTTDIMGGYRHYIISRISHFVLKLDAASWVRSVSDKTSTAPSSSTSLVATMVFPIESLADVAVPQMMHYFCMFVHAMGFENILGVGVFVNRVVYETVFKLGYTWLFALELFLVYIKALDSSSESTMTSIWGAGSQDTYLTAAKEEFKRRWGNNAMFFRTRGGTPLGKGPLGDDEDGPHDSSNLNDGKGNAGGTRKWNGKFNTSPTARPCPHFNTHSTHPQGALREDGSCKFAHVCDHFVTDKGPNGRCRSEKHTRDKCDNPSKGARQQ